MSHNVSVPYSFVQGTASSADNVNSNYAALVNYINARNGGTEGWDNFVLYDASATYKMTIVGATHAAARTYTIPDAGAAAKFVMSEGTQTVNTALTMGANIAMGTHKLTGLSAGSASGESVRYEQVLGFRILQIVSSSTTAVANSTTTVFADTNLTATITPTLSTSKVLVIVSQVCEAAGGNGVTVCSLQLLSAGSIIDGPNAACYQGAVVANDVFNTHVIVKLDSPATTNAVIYKTQFARGGGTGTASVNDSFNTIASKSTITLFEIG